MTGKMAFAVTTKTVSDNFPRRANYYDVREAIRKLLLSAFLNLIFNAYKMVILHIDIQYCKPLLKSTAGTEMASRPKL